MSNKSNLRLAMGQSMVQTMAVFCLLMMIIFVTVPRAIGGILEGRINSEGGCNGARYDSASIWSFIRSARLGDCVVTNSEFHGAHLLKSQTVGVLVFFAIALILFCIYFFFNGPIGAGDAASTMFTTILAGGVIVVTLVVILRLLNSS